MIRCPVYSSCGPEGDEPKFCVLMRLSPPKAESCRLRKASDGSRDFFGSEDGGDSRPNFEGTDAATGPCRAM